MEGTKQVTIARILLRVATVNHRNTVNFAVKDKLVISVKRAFTFLKIQLLRLIITEIIRNVSADIKKKDSFLNIVSKPPVVGVLDLDNNKRRICPAAW